MSSESEPTQEQRQTETLDSSVPLTLVGEGTLKRLAPDINKGPSKSVRAIRYKPGSHTELQITQTQGSPIAPEHVFYDARGEAKTVLASHGELSLSFFDKPPTRGARTRTSHRLDAAYREAGVHDTDRQTYRDLVRGADTTAVSVPNRPSGTGIVSSATRDIAEQALEGIRRIRGYLAETRKAKAST